MIELHFRGWFQVRLATDPDPYDEPRGVSGYVHAYAGEPDLDRILYFQRPPFVRAYGPPIGVYIDRIDVNGASAPEHPLLGAAVDLLDRPKFEGRNGVIAEDGLEPIFPFVLCITKDGFSASRAISPANANYPFDEFLASGVQIDPGGISNATGIDSLREVWTERIAKLKAHLESAEEPQRTANLERLAFLETQIDPRGAIRFFVAKMSYSYDLKSAAKIHDSRSWLPSDVAFLDPWKVEFWLGAWDADVLCGYCLGTLRVPFNKETIPSARSLRRPL